MGEDYPKVSLLTRVTSVKSTSMSRLELPATFEFVCMSLCPYLCCLKTHFAVLMHYSQVKQYILGIVHFPFRQRFNVTYRYSSSKKIFIQNYDWMLALVFSSRQLCVASSGNSSGLPWETFANIHSPGKTDGRWSFWISKAALQLH